jgi:UrcA family protein
MAKRARNLRALVKSILLEYDHHLIAHLGLLITRIEQTNSAWEMYSCRVCGDNSRTEQMKRFVVSLFASAAFLAPLASADEASTAVNIVIPVDASLLTSIDGTETVMNKIKSEARRACAFETSISYIPMVDKDCVAELLLQAETQLSSPEIILASVDSIKLVANAK